MKLKLPAYIEDLEDGPHKWDMIRHYKKELRKNARDRSGSDKGIHLR